MRITILFPDDFILISPSLGRFIHNFFKIIWAHVNATNTAKFRYGIPITHSGPFSPAHVDIAHYSEQKIGMKRPSVYEGAIIEEPIYLKIFS